MGQRHKHADVIIAWAEGKDVQVWDEDAKCWWNARTPSFYEDRKYRIKPPAKKYRVGLFIHPATGLQLRGALAYVANDQEQATKYESLPSFIRWLTDWIEYEYEE